MEQPLPPEVRQIGRPGAGLWPTALRLVSALPFAGLAVLGARLAVIAPGPLASTVLASLACIPAWLCARSVVRTLRMYHGSELASAIGHTMVTVAFLMGVVGLLFAVFYALMRPYMRVHTEGATKGNLGATRSALSIYYGDMEGVYPLTLDALTVSGKYMGSIPRTSKLRSHPDSRQVTFGAVSDDAGGWLYANDPADKAHFGTLWINCTHTDPKGTVWTSY